jgi:hypothetical protein
MSIYRKTALQLFPVKNSAHEICPRPFSRMHVTHLPLSRGKESMVVITHMRLQISFQG